MRIGLLILFGFIGIYTVSAQQQDAVFMQAISIEKKINRSFSLTAYEQCGFNENGTELGYAIGDIGVQFKINEQIMLGGNYRIAGVHGTDNQYALRHFLYTDLTLQSRWQDFSGQLRIRYVDKMYAWHMPGELTYRPDKHYVRIRGQLRYDFSYHHDVFASYENVYRLDDKQETEWRRWTAGYGYTINLHHKLQLTYTVAAQQNTDTPDTDFISGITYFYKF